MKESFYFPHDFNARNDPKLQQVLMEHGVAGIGIYWCLVEQIYEQNGILPLSSCKSIAFALHVECNVLESIVNDFDLFQSDGVNFWSESINRRLDKRVEIAEKRKKAAVISWQSRRSMQMQSKSDANAMVCNAIKEKKRKENESINNNINRKGQDENAKRFAPPTIEDVQSYIQEKGYSVDAESFVAFYTSKNWYVGKNKMKDWHAALVTWQKRERPGRKPTTNINVNEIWDK